MRLAKQSQFIHVQNVVNFRTLPVLVLKIFTFYINDVLLFKCLVPGPKDQFCFRIVLPVIKAPKKVNNATKHDILNCSNFL